MKEHRIDCLIIGSGPGGQKAAIQAAKLGRSVMVVEKDPFIGGASLNSGTIPSKSLREAIIDLTGFYQRSYYAPGNSLAQISINDLNFRLSKTLNTLRHELHRHFQNNHIDVIHGSASFVSPFEIEVISDEGFVSDRIVAEKIIISTGSTPRNPSHIPFDDKKILDSTRLLSIDKLPEKIVVLGGGIIGAEYASFFAALGVKVILVDKGPHILPLLDREIGIQLQNYLIDLGLEFQGHKKFSRVEMNGDQVCVFFEDGCTIDADIFLYAMGREANVEDLCIHRAHIILDAKGYIPVNSLFQISNVSS